MGRRKVIDVDGSRFSGSGSIVRQAVGFAAVTGQAVRVTNARARRPKPGLRPQHAHAVRSMCDLVGGSVEGADVGSRTVTFWPGNRVPEGSYTWDIGTAGSTTAFALSVLPLLACRGRGVEIELRGGVFQQWAPSPFHLQHVVLPLLARMGATIRLEIVRPGYLPAGRGVIRLFAAPAPRSLQPLVLDRRGDLQMAWGIALSSHLAHAHVSARMAKAAREILAKAGQSAAIDEREDASAASAGAAFALFADLDGGVRLGADGVGALRRRAERIGSFVAHRLLSEVASGATLDRFACDQLMPFAALAAGESIFHVAEATEHLRTGGWLASSFLGAEQDISGGRVCVHGAG